MRGRGNGQGAATVRLNLVYLAALIAFAQRIACSEAQRGSGGAGYSSIGRPGGIPGGGPAGGPSGGRPVAGAGGGLGGVSGDLAIHDNKDSISVRVVDHSGFGSAGGAADCLSGVWGALLAGGVVSAGGGFSDGVCRLVAGTFSTGGGLAPVVRSAGGASGPGAPGGFGSGVSTLPRMIGRPSLPLPMITILALLD